MKDILAYILTAVACTFPVLVMGEPVSARIIAGSTVQEEWPQIAMLMYRDGSDFYVGCAGTLIAPSKVLTAAHCVDDRTPYQVILGRKVISSYTGTVATINSIDIHPDFKLQTLENDLAIITLNEVVNAPALPLADEDQMLRLDYSSNLRVFGWGYTQPNFSKPSETLQAATVQYIPLNICNGPSSYRGLVTKSMLCAGFMAGGADSCGGDSGGPLLDLSGPVPVQVGIVSWGSAKLCGAPNKPGVYTRVASFYEWIQKQIAAPAKISAIEQFVKYSRKRDNIVGFARQSAPLPMLLVRNGTNVFSITATGRQNLLRLKHKQGSLNIADTNGDGVDELLQTNGKKVIVYSLVGTKYHPVQQYSLRGITTKQFISAAAGDIDGDGVAELVTIHGSTLSLYSFSNQIAEPLLRLPVKSKHVLIGAVEIGQPAIVFVANGKTYQPLSLNATNSISISSNRPPAFTAVGSNFLIDVNGDGRIELVSFSKRRKKWKVSVKSPNL